MSRDGEPRVSAESGAGPEPEPSPEPRPGPGAPGDPDGEAFRADVRDALTGLAARLDREHERAAHREAVIDRLHEENQRLRRGELQSMLEPVRAALYRLHDQARRESGRLAAPGLADPPDPRGTALLLAAVADDVADALARLGVERFTVEPGAPYDAARHRPVAVTPVDDPLRDGTVTGVESDGFEQSGKVLRKAAVSVGRLDAKRGTSGTEAEAGSNGAGRAVKAASSHRHSAGNGETMTPDPQTPDTQTPDTQMTDG
ncbi:nucleotide exchange factor GrpE [Actinomadura sp. 9N215]|uniref:nucleotide exchange factor GrpE n=1 Tax=Actinomadura sp. 9N215 TaxID=3375150 RepID=UPI0037A85AEE